MEKKEGRTLSQVELEKYGVKPWRIMRQTKLSTGNVETEREHVMGVIIDLKVPLFPFPVVEGPEEKNAA